MYRTACHDHFRKTIQQMSANDRRRDEVLICLKRLQAGRWKGGTRVKRLGATGILEARVNGGDRLLFSVSRPDWLVIYDLVEHDYVNRAYRRIGDHAEANARESDVLTQIPPPPESCPDATPEDVIAQDPWRTRYTADNIPRFLVPPAEVWQDEVLLMDWCKQNDASADLMLTPEQEELTLLSEPVILNGSAGSGKSTVIVHSLAIHQKAHPGVPALYVTFLPDLRKNAETLYDALQHHMGGSIERPEFLTYSELCARVVAAGGGTLPGSLFSEREFQAWLKLWLRKQRGLHLQIPVPALWCEIRGVVKGRNGDPRQPMLSLSDYEALATAEGMVPRACRKDVWQVAQAYQNHLADQNRQDEMDMTRMALAAAEHDGPNLIYSAIFCDEVQDLTQLQLSLLFRIWKTNQARLFMAGDVHQVIYPSAFRWPDIMRVFYGPDGQTARYRSEALTRNFRSSGGILRLAEATLKGLKRSLIRPFLRAGQIRWTDPPEGAHDGPPGLPPVRIDATEEECLQSLRKLPASARRVVLTRTTEQRDWLDERLNGTVGQGLMVSESPMTAAIEQHDRENIFCVDEYKGLEADCVVLWRFFEGTEGFWAKVAVTGEASGLYDILIECNRLYVALTRAQRYLAIFDEPQDPTPWHLGHFEGVEFDHEPSDWLRVVQPQGSSAEELAEYGRLLEKRGLLPQAAAAFANGGDDEAAGRCRARVAEADEDWVAAAAEWYRIRRWSDARRCFSAAQEASGVRHCDAEELEEESAWEKAARVWRELREKPREAVAWEQAGQWEEAKSCWRELPDSEKRLSFHLRHMSKSLKSLDKALAEATRRTAKSTRLWRLEHDKTVFAKALRSEENL